jgi:hypothetical protein
MSGNVMPEEGEITKEPKVVWLRLREVGVYCPTLAPEPCNVRPAKVGVVREPRPRLSRAKLKLVSEPRLSALVK